MKFNNPNTLQELDKKRSDRLNTGHYEARCMQPLFHKSQYINGVDYSEKISALQNKTADLQGALDLKNDCGFFWPIKWLLNPYSNLSEDDIQTKIASTCRKLEIIPNKRKPTEAQMKMAKRCEKYATYAILSQQSNPSVAFEKNCIKEEDITCCGKTLYKSKTYCGVISKIDCCAQRCWAINLLCCAIGIWPEGGRVYVL